MPFLAPIPLPTMMATGVARPSAQGQLTTSTEMPLARENPRGCRRITSHSRVTSTAITITAGTKMPEIVSASRAMGALVAAASLTMRMICARLVSSPTLVASQRR